MSVKNAIALLFGCSMLCGELWAQVGFVAKVLASNHCCSLVEVVGPGPNPNDRDALCKLVRNSARDKMLVYASVLKHGGRPFALPRPLGDESFGQWDRRYMERLGKALPDDVADVLLTRNGCRLRLPGAQGIQAIEQVDAERATPEEIHLLKSVVYVHMTPGLKEQPLYGAVFVSSTDPITFVKQVSANWPGASRSSFEFVIRPDRCFGQYPYFPSFHPLERNPPCPGLTSNVESTVCETLAGLPAWRCRGEPLKR